MATWFKSKPKLTPRSQYPPEILQGIHTMENDLHGEGMPATPSTEPLVAFEPKAATQGAPFYADPSMLAQPESVPLGTNDSVGTSPFLNETPPPSTLEDSPLQFEPPHLPPETAAVLEINPDAATPVSVDQQAISLTNRKSFGIKQWLSRYRLFLFIGGAVLLLLLLGGLAWWWFNRAPQIPVVTREGDIQEATSAPTLSVEAVKPGTTHYSTSQPQLLSFDTETVTAETIKTEFLKIALSIKQDNLQGPVEFFVRDQNYNPLAFSRFAYLLGLDLSSDMLAALDEDFSIFFYLDGERTRIGLELSIKNSEDFLVALARDEHTLPKTLEPFFLDTTTAPKVGLVFRSGLYREQPVRYANIDVALNLSVDSAVRGNSWLIGTSQNTLRALLDRPTP